MAEKIKITIKLNPSQSTASTPPIVSAPKPPFDLRKITGAILLSLSVLATSIYFIQPLTAQSVEPSVILSEQTETRLSAPPTPPQANSASSEKAAQTSQSPTQQTIITINNHDSANENANQALLPTTEPAKLASDNNQQQPDETRTLSVTKPVEPTSLALNDQHADSLSSPAEPAPTSGGLENNTHQPAQHSWFNQQLVRAQLTSNIHQREPQDRLDNVALAQLNKLYLFVELRQMQGQTVEVHWYKEQQLQASVALAIGGPRWRTYASKLFNSHSRGQWRVAIFQQQQLIFEQYFTVQ
ncbi:DUF2914 domain-containing protein [Agarivorans sp.]|uniref:DUF2914 domain-containing protein n=1 Tax=Agarivorans sp. TaxID=1872412 RepID=UPI003D0364EA